MMVWLESRKRLGAEMGGWRGKEKKITIPKSNEMIENDERRGEAGGRSVFPILLDSETPLPGEVVVLVVVSELWLDVVGAASHHPFGRLLHGGEELVLLGWPRPIASNHVVRLIHWERDREMWLEKTSWRHKERLRPDCSYRKLVSQTVTELLLHLEYLWVGFDP